MSVARAEKGEGAGTAGRRAAPEPTAERTGSQSAPRGWEDRMEAAVGLFCASFFSAAYVLVPAWFLAAFILAARMAMRPDDAAARREAAALLALLLPIAVSAATPTRAIPTLFATRAFACVLRYFKYSEILEVDDMALFEHTTQVKPVVIAASPHGVISLGGLCALAYDFRDAAEPRSPRAPGPGTRRRSIGARAAEYAAMSAREKHLFRLHMLFAQLPTAVVNALRVAPVLKHVLGIIGLISASKRDLVARLRRRRGFVIYPGGMAEMFFSSPAAEKLYLSKRKGFIRLAIMHGADVVPTYFFGNTTALRVVQNPLLEWVSRKLKVSLTVFYGRWLLPVPFPVEIMHVRGKILKLPFDEKPTEETVDFYHKQYVDEVVRLFTEYRKRTATYRDRELIVV